MSTRYMHEKAEPNPSFSRRSNGPKETQGVRDRKEGKTIKNHGESKKG